MSDLLRVQNLQVHYGAVQAVKGIDLVVGTGETVALIGANGAGKSSTLMALSGIVPKVGGEVFFEGTRMDALPAEEIVRSGISQVPEGRHVFPEMTIIENLKLGATMSTQDEAQDMDWCFELFPKLKQRSMQLAGTLSGGEQQMLVLARGLMARPKLLLLDEPSLGLAPKIVEQVFKVIQQIRQKGVSILLVEQNAYQALQVADRAYVLETGEVNLEGKAADLAADPAVRSAYLGGVV